MATCNPYSLTFSHESMARSMKAHAFPFEAKRTPEKCDGSPWLQKGSRCSYVAQGEKGDLTNLLDAEFDKYVTPAGKVDLNRDGIALAVEKRVALFFQQTVLCYGMSDFTFSAKTADGQVGIAPKLTLKTASKKSITLNREAAHSSTIPTLIATPKDNSSTPFVFLKGGSSYYQHNATISMSECVNGADELLDGKGLEDKLRDRTIALINKVAQRTLNPVEATKKFCESFLEKAKFTAQSLEATDPRKFVLEQYVKEIEEIKESDAFDHLLGVTINPDHAQEKVLREVVYQKRYDVLQLQEVIESRIGKRISDFQKTMGTRSRPFLEHVLLEEFPQNKGLKVFEKLTGKTSAFLKNKTPPIAQKSFQTRIKNLREIHKETLPALLQSIRDDFAELQRAEITYRAGLFKDLRTKVNSWTQAQFCSEHLKKTATRVSQSWVSRVEQLSRLSTKPTYASPLSQRRRVLKIQEAKKCAKTFGVDAGLFLPGLFTS